MGRNGFPADSVPRLIGAPPDIRWAKGQPADRVHIASGVPLMIWCGASMFSPPIELDTYSDMGISVVIAIIGGALSLYIDKQRRLISLHR